MTTTTAPTRAYASNTSVVWRLKDYAKVWSFGSRVYIRWSDKLGLSIDGRNERRAKQLVEQVLVKGTITPELWEKHFYPNQEFGCIK